MIPGGGVQAGEVVDEFGLLFGGRGDGGEEVGEAHGGLGGGIEGVGDAATGFEAGLGASGEDVVDGGIGDARSGAAGQFADAPSTFVEFLFDPLSKLGG